MSFEILRRYVKPGSCVEVVYQHLDQRMSRIGILKEIFDEVRPQ